MTSADDDGDDGGDGDDDDDDDDDEDDDDDDDDDDGDDDDSTGRPSHGPCLCRALPPQTGWGGEPGNRASESDGRHLGTGGAHGES